MPERFPLLLAQNSHGGGKPSIIYPSSYRHSPVSPRQLALVASLIQFADAGASHAIGQRGYEARCPIDAASVTKCESMRSNLRPRSSSRFRWRRCNMSLKSLNRATMVLAFCLSPSAQASVSR
jgi:hypothetical protein